MRSPYEVLGVRKNATDREIQQARRKLLFDLHPDRLPKDLPEGAAKLINERVLEINNAFERIQEERSRSGTSKTSANQENSNKQDRKSASKETQKTEPQKKHNERKTKSESSNSSKSGNKEGAAARVVGQIISVLIGVSLMQTCRQAMRYNQTTQSYADRVDSITTSTMDYCPELESSIEQGRDTGEDMHLKMLSEMKRNAPEGSSYKSRVEELIQQLKNDNGNPPQSTKDEINSVFSNYLPLVCEGRLHLAKERANGVKSELTSSETTQQAQTLFANAMCGALRDGARMDTVDERRSVGAIYMGKEMDKVPEEERETIRIEIAQNTENKSWMNQAMVAFVKRCPEIAHKFVE